MVKAEARTDVVISLLPTPPPYPNPTLGSKHVIAGHMWYGMHKYVKNPLYITCLRDPLATAVSSQLYIKRKLLRNVGDDEAALKVKEWWSGWRSGWVNGRVGRKGGIRTRHAYNFI